MNSTSRALIGVGVVTACLVSGQVQAAPVLYGITWGSETVSEKLIRIDITTGAGTVVGPLSIQMDAYGLGATGGKLYAYDQNADLLREINPATAALVNSIDLGLGNQKGEGGIDFRSDGVGFLYSASIAGSGSGHLYSFTTSAQSGAEVGVQNTVLDGLAFSSTSTLFALSQADGSTKALYTVNQSNGVLTLIGLTGIPDVSSIGGLDFVGSTLYAVINNSLYTLDTDTGAATLIGETNFRNVSGLTSLDVNGTPEPAILTLFGLGLAGLGAVRRRRTVS